MGKIAIPITEFPRLYVQEIIIAGSTQRAFAKAIGISAPMLTRYKARYSKEIEDERIKQTKGSLIGMSTKQELDTLYIMLNERLKKANDNDDEDGILRIAKPIIEILKARGMVERVGMTTNNYDIDIMNLTAEQLTLAIGPISRPIIEIIKKFVATDKQEECLNEMDMLFSRMGAK